MTIQYLAPLLLASALISGCDGPATVDAPIIAHELDRDAIGYYCQMTVLDHTGPKGQVFLSDSDQPLWFTSVRDTIAFTRLPGEPKNIAAIYVTDVGRASWDSPEPGTWIDARQAVYVIGSDRLGGMQAPELVPFSERKAAESFVASHGGEIVAFDAIPMDSVLEGDGQGQPGQ